MGHVGTGGGREGLRQAGQAGDCGGAVGACAEAVQVAEAVEAGGGDEVVGRGWHQVGLQERVCV